MFIMWQHICVSILLTRGWHYYAGRAIYWALPRISSFSYSCATVDMISADEARHIILLQ